MSHGTLNEYLTELRSIPWFARSAENGAMQDADGGIQVKWDRFGSQTLEVWEREIHDLEDLAVKSIGDAEIDELFTAVSDTIHDPLYHGICSLIDRMYSGHLTPEMHLQRTVDESIFPELMDSVKRDVTWAGVEFILNKRGFFSLLLDYYREGKWPYSWSGRFSNGIALVF